MSATSSSLLFILTFLNLHSSSLTIINYGHLKSNVHSIKEREHIKLKECLESVGFFILTNHGMDHQVMDKAWNDSIAFFDSNESNKQSVPMTKEYIYGYQNKEILSRSEENEEADSNILDAKETFQVYIGAKNTTRHLDVLWPPYPTNMNESWTLYYRQLEFIMDGLLQSVASILDLENDFFEQFNDDHMAAMRATNYPSIETDEKIGHRCSPHTDWTLLTLLRQDIIGGLQVEDKNNGEWIDIVTDFYDLIVNVGDLLQRWTNNRFISARHRVVDFKNKNEREMITKRRQSMVFFYFVNGDTLIDTITTCLKEDQEQQYEPVSVWDYLAAKQMISTNL